MYLIIYEDGNIERIDSIDDKDMLLASVEDGLIDLIDITGCENPLQYYQERWHPLIDAVGG